MNLAVIGLGSISKRHRKNLRATFPDAIIIAMPARNRKVNNFNVSDADYIANDIESVIEYKPDLAVIASPASMHVMHAEKLIEKGIPVLIEKPIGLNKKGIDRIISIAKEKEIAAAVAYCLRYMPSSSVVKNIIENNGLGIIYNVNAEAGQYLPDWRSDKDFKHSVSVSTELGGGVLLELSHEFDYLQWFFGKLKFESALLRSSKELNLDVEEMADIILSTNEGIVCYVHLDFLQKNAKRQCIVTGSEGRIEWDLIKNEVVMYKDGDSNVLYSNPEWDSNEMYISLLEDFIANKEGADSNVLCSLTEAEMTLELVLNIKEFAVLGERV